MSVTLHLSLSTVRSLSDVQFISSLTSNLCMPTYRQNITENNSINLHAQDTYIDCNSQQCTHAEYCQLAKNI